MVPLGNGRLRKRLDRKAQRAAYSAAKQVWGGWELRPGPDGFETVVTGRPPMRRVGSRWGWLLVAQGALRGLVRLLRSEVGESRQEGR